MIGRPYISTHVDPTQLAPLLARVLPEATLRELAETALRDEPTLLGGVGPHPTAEALVAQALGGSDTTAGAVLFALHHHLKNVMEEVSSAPPEQLTDELSVCELLERRQPAHLLLALLLDNRPQLNSLGTALLDEYCRIRDSTRESGQEEGDTWSAPPPPEPAQAGLAHASEGTPDALLRSELEAVLEENQALAERVRRLEERLAVLLEEAPGPPDDEPESPPAAAGDTMVVETATEAAETIFAEPAETPTRSEPAARPSPPAFPASTVELEGAASSSARLLRGEHILLLGGDPLRRADYASMLAELGARPMVVPQVGDWDELQIKQLVGEADFIVALGNTILDANVARLLRVAEERGVRRFRYHSTAVAGVRHYLQSLVQEGLV